jgi:hypothetical protein
MNPTENRLAGWEKREYTYHFMEIKWNQDSGRRELFCGERCLELAKKA